MEKIQVYITSDIIIFSPPDWKYEYFKKQLGIIEFEKVYINGKHNRNQIYMEYLITKEGETEIKLENEK